MLSYASTLSSGDFFRRTRLAIFPGSMVPICESSLNSLALLIVAARKISLRDKPAFCLPEIIQHPAINHCQVDKRGIAEVEIGTRKLFEIFLDDCRLGFSLTKAHLRPHSRNRS